MTIDEAISFFEENDKSKIVSKLLPLQQVGLGYIQLGQSSNTLSGGEAQRIKLAFFLQKGINLKTMFILMNLLDYTFTISKNYYIRFNALIENGHTIICVEHNSDVIKCADWLIDLGPEGGEKWWGFIVSKEHLKT